MKKDIQPKVHNITARCVCGFSLETTSTKEAISVDICSHCHPFCTGTQKFIDEAGRIEKFERRYKNEQKKKSKK